jgi:hypothetical protein
MYKKIVDNLMKDINLDAKENIFELLNFLTRYN